MCDLLPSDSLRQIFKNRNEIICSVQIFPPTIRHHSFKFKSPRLETSSSAPALAFQRRNNCNRFLVTFKNSYVPVGSVPYHFTVCLAQPTIWNIPFQPETERKLSHQLRHHHRSQQHQVVRLHCDPKKAHLLKQECITRYSGSISICVREIPGTWRYHVQTIKLIHFSPIWHPSSGGISIKRIAPGSVWVQFSQHQCD